MQYNREILQFFLSIANIINLLVYKLNTYNIAYNIRLLSNVSGL